ncbi:MAG: hypothetical protein QM682_02365 [Paracoccus sp. (in: a-proteobacteria)]|uniref:hypothetical protein n=1 Tax=Paracoccus sp. TaxID=267 RepID=UPI0039E542F4
MTMYFDSKTLTAILSDAATEERAAAAIAGTRKRFTSPLAVAGTILGLKDKGLEPAELEVHVLNYLKLAEIELRDMPPSQRLIEAATKAVMKGGGELQAVLEDACAAYYEVERFSLDAPAPDQPA